jgi:hypothetical protein
VCVCVCVCVFQSDTVIGLVLTYSHNTYHASKGAPVFNNIEDAVNKAVEIVEAKRATATAGGAPTAGLNLRRHRSH